MNKSTEQELPRSAAFPGVLESREEGRIVPILQKPTPLLERDEMQ